MLRAIREARPPGERLTLPALKQILADQFLLVQWDAERAIQALPGLLANEPELRAAALATLHRVLKASGQMSDEGKRRLTRVEALFGGPKAAAQSKPEMGHA